MENKGELESYYVEDDHPAIISRVVFLAVEEEMARRAAKFNAPAERSVATPRPEESLAFTSKIVCAGCGTNFRRRTMNASNKWRKVFWQCGTYMRLGKNACLAKQIPEQTLLNITARFDGKPIQRITAEFPNKLNFTFEDGTETYYEWSEKDEYSSDHSTET